MCCDAVGAGAHAPMTAFAQALPSAWLVREPPKNRVPNASITLGCVCATRSSSSCATIGLGRIDMATDSPYERVAPCA